MLEKLFHLKKSHTNVRTEIIAGLTTFFAMVYIIFVNPEILSKAGMPWGGVFIATILSAVVGTLIMGFVANVPYAVAPGMGLNAFFTYTVCMQYGFSWREALAMVFICGLINILITVTKLRKAIIKSIPRSLQLAIGGGIGLFIAYIGMKNGDLLAFGGTSAAATLGSAAVPALVDFTMPSSVLTVIGLLLTIVLMVRKVKGSLFIGILATTLIGIPMGVTIIPTKLFDLSAFNDFGTVSFAFFGADGLRSLFSKTNMLPVVLITIFSFSLSDTFDTIGTFIGTGRKSGIFDAEDEKALENSSGFKSRMDRALFADATATSIGALLGTSNATTFVESAAGIGVGGRTGLTSVVVALLFLLCLPFAGLFGMVPAAATAPALIIVGILMVEAFADINWKDIAEAAPAFITVLFMGMAYSISTGIAAGFIVYTVINVCTGKAKQVHPILYVVSGLFLLNYFLQALGIGG